MDEKVEVIENEPCGCKIERNGFFVNVYKCDRHKGL